MQQKDKIEQIRFVINRFDHFYDTVNNKGNVYLTLNAFLLGGLIAGYYTLQKDNSITMGECYLFAIGAIFNLCAMGLAIAAILPYMNFDGNSSMASLINYNDIASYSEKELQEKVDEQTEEKLLQDLVHQKQLLSKGLTRKFKFLWWATFFTGGQLVVLFILGLLLIKI